LNVWVLLLETTAGDGDFIDTIYRFPETATLVAMALSLRQDLKQRSDMARDYDIGHAVVDEDFNEIQWPLLKEGEDKFVLRRYEVERRLWLSEQETLLFRLVARYPGNWREDAAGALKRVGDFHELGSDSEAGRDLARKFEAYGWKEMVLSSRGEQKDIDAWCRERLGRA